MSVRASKRAEYDARKPSRSGPTHDQCTAPVLEWRFGVGQTGPEERAEMERAGLAGRGYEYSAAQGVARAEEAATPPRKPKSTRNTKARAPSARTSSSSLSSSAPGPDLRTYMAALLDDVARQVLRPEPVTLPNLPTYVPAAVLAVAQDVALCVGTRLAVGDDRPLPYACRWRAGVLGISHEAVSAALKTLVRWKSLKRAGALPGRRGRGTALYAVPGFTSLSDGVPDAEFEAAPVAVEAQDVGARGTAIEPAGEGVDKPGVSDAVRGGTARALDGVSAAQGSAGDGLSGGHTDVRYDRFRLPTPDHLLTRATEMVFSGAGTERDAACWLACQLRDNRVADADAVEPMMSYAGTVSARFTTRDALSTLKSVYARPPRDPWGVRTGADR